MRNAMRAILNSVVSRFFPFIFTTGFGDNAEVLADGWTH